MWGAECGAGVGHGIYRIGNGGFRATLWAMAQPFCASDIARTTTTATAAMNMITATINNIKT